MVLTFFSQLMFALSDLISSRAQRKRININFSFLLLFRCFSFILCYPLLNMYSNEQNDKYKKEEEEEIHFRCVLWQRATQRYEPNDMHMIEVGRRKCVVFSLHFTSIR